MAAAKCAKSTPRDQNGLDQPAVKMSGMHKGVPPELDEVVRESAAHDVRLVAAAISIGTTLEWYDFVIYTSWRQLVFNKVFFRSFRSLAGHSWRLAYAVRVQISSVRRGTSVVSCSALGDRPWPRFVHPRCTPRRMGVPRTHRAIAKLINGWGESGVLLLLSHCAFVARRRHRGIGPERGACPMEHGHSPNGQDASFAQLGPACATILGTRA